MKKREGFPPPSNIALSSESVTQGELKSPGKTGNACDPFVGAAGSKSAGGRVVVRRPPGSTWILSEIHITVAQQVKDVEVDAELTKPFEANTLLQPEVEV